MGHLAEPELEARRGGAHHGDGDELGHHTTSLLETFLAQDGSAHPVSHVVEAPDEVKHIGRPVHTRRTP